VWVAGAQLAMQSVWRLILGAVLRLAQQSVWPSAVVTLRSVELPWSLGQQAPGQFRSVFASNGHDQ